MRKKIIKLLRLLEQESCFKNEYGDRLMRGEMYSVEEFLDFPDYRLIIKRFNDKYVVTKENGLISPTSSSSIRAELKRMEADGLVMISVQEGVKFAKNLDGKGPDYNDEIFTSESVVLTTKGKSWWGYLLHKFTENPISLILSIIAIIISVFL